MRNTTKLKLLLQKYTVSLDLNDDETFLLILSDKSTNNMHEFVGKSYSVVISKAYSFMIRVLKNELQKNKNFVVPLKYERKS